MKLDVNFSELYKSAAEMIGKEDRPNEEALELLVSKHMKQNPNNFSFVVDNGHKHFMSDAILNYFGLSPAQSIDGHTCSKLLKLNVLVLEKVFERTEQTLFPGREGRK